MEKKFQAFLITFFLQAMLFVPFILYGQNSDALDFVIKVPLTNEGTLRGVRANDSTLKWHRWAATIPARPPGYYKFIPQAEYTIEKEGGEMQHNESFYFTVIAQDSTPVNPNAGPYRVVPDSSDIAGKVRRYAGTFYLAAEPDTLSLWMHHYAAIAREYPQHLLELTWEELIHTPNSVKFDTLLWVVRDSVARFEDGALAVKAIAPRTEIIKGTEKGLVYADEVIHYRLIIRNPGKNVITAGKLYNRMPATLIPDNFSFPPEEISGENIVWKLPYIVPQDSFIITFDAKLPDKMPVGLNPLLDQAILSIPNDTYAENDSARVTLYSLADSNGVRPLATDIGLSLLSETGVVNSDSTCIVKPGGIVNFTLNVYNNGPDFARDVRLATTIPPYFTLKGINIKPHHMDGSTLGWEFASIEPYTTITFQYYGEVFAEIPESDSLLLSQAQITAANDNSSDNNFDIDSVLIVRKSKNYDVALTHRALTDDMIVVGGDTVPAVQPAHTYAHALLLQNNGPATAFNLNLWSKLPDSVSVHTFSIPPTSLHLDTLFWVIDSLSPGQQIQFDYQTTLTDSLQFEPFELFSVSEVIAENDTALANNRDSTSVYGYHKQLPSPEHPDLQVTHNVQTDTFIVIETDTVRTVIAGTTYRHELILENLGPTRAYNAVLWSLLPDSVIVTGYNIDPVRHTPDSLFWTFDSLDINALVKVNYETRLADVLPHEPFELFSVSQIFAENDTALSNNRDSLIVYGYNIPSTPTNKTDLALTCTAQTDTFVVISGDTVKAVVAGTTYRHELIVDNLGPVTAYNAVLWSKLPDRVSVIGFDIDPVRQNQDTLFWAFDSIIVSAEIRIGYETRLADTLPTLPFPLKCVSEIIAEQDTAPANNFASNLVYGISDTVKQLKSTDLAISIRSITDTTLWINNRMRNAVVPGSLYKYEIFLENKGPARGDQIQVTLQLPDNAKYIEAIPKPAVTQEGAVLWQFADLASGEDSVVIVSTKLSSDISHDIKTQMSSVTLTAQNDSTSYNNADMDTIFVLHKSNVPVAGNSDIALSYAAIADTFTIIASDTVQAVFEGDSFRYLLRIDNHGPSVVHNLILWTTVPDSVAISRFDIQPGAIKNDTLFWNIDTLALNTAWTNTFEPIVAGKVPDLPFQLSSTAKVIATQDTTADNNSETVNIYVIAPVDNEKIADIAVRQFTRTDSFAVVDQDTLKFVKEGETYTYHIVVNNPSDKDAEDVILCDLLPDSVQIQAVTPTPQQIENDTLKWHLDILAAGDSRTFRVDVTVPVVMPVGLNRLTNQVWVNADNEDPASSDNNTSMDTVYNQVRQIDILNPKIEATPPVVDVTESIRVRVQVPPRTASWDLSIHFPDGAIDSDFADDFIANNILVPDVWYDIDETYTPIRLVSNEIAEDWVFEIQTKDVYGNTASAQTVVQVHSSNYLVLDRNVFKPDTETPLGIKFKLSSHRIAQLDVYDISGRHIAEITRDVYDGGWNVYPWDGNGKNGQKTGSGVYIVTLRSGEFNSWKKFLLVR